jgi:hypothetical protein
LKICTLFARSYQYVLQAQENYLLAQLYNACHLTFFQGNFLNAAVTVHIVAPTAASSLGSLLAVHSTAGSAAAASSVTLNSAAS